MTERQLQEAVAQLLDRLGWLWFHPPNEGKRTGRNGQGLVRAGLKKGVPDVLILEDWDVAGAEDRGHGIALELKAGKGKATEDQLRWRYEMTERGWLAYLCYTMDDVLAALQYVRPKNGRTL